MTVEPIYDARDVPLRLREIAADVFEVVQYVDPEKIGVMLMVADHATRQTVFTSNWADAARDLETIKRQIAFLAAIAARLEAEPETTA